MMRHYFYNSTITIEIIKYRVSHKLRVCGQKVIRGTRLVLLETARAFFSYPITGAHEDRHAFFDFTLCHPRLSISGSEEPE